MSSVGSSVNLQSLIDCNVYEKIDFEECELLDEEELVPLNVSDSKKSKMLLDEEEKEYYANEHMDLVYFLSNKYSNTYIDRDEIFSVALVGLGKALDSFNKNSDVKFTTFAYTCINNIILSFLSKQDKVRRKNISLNTVIAGEDESDKKITLENVFSNDTKEDNESIEDEIEKTDGRSFVRFIIKKHLNYTEEKIICCRFGIGEKYMTQESIANEMEVSQATISKMEKDILNKLKQILITEYNKSLEDLF